MKQYVVVARYADPLYVVAGCQGARRLDIPVIEREKRHLPTHVERCELRWRQSRLLMLIIMALVIGVRLSLPDVLALVSKILGVG